MPDLDSNLEQRIAAWRRQMAGAGIRSADALDELESHLRDEIEHLSQSHPAPSNVWFEEAVRKLGSATALNQEFQHAHQHHRTKVMKTKLIHSLVVLAVFATGLGFICPAVAKWQLEDAPAAFDLITFTIGTALAGAAVFWCLRLAIHQIKGSRV